MKRPVLMALALLAVACSDPGDTSGPDAAPPPACNPIVGDDCVTPFPTSYYEAAAATATGVQIAIPDAVLPVSIGGSAISAQRLNGKDGFSPASPFLVHFNAGVDATQLPGMDDLAASMAATSPIQIIDFATGMRVPLLAELDANALVGERRALIIRPQIRLRGGTRYVVALVGLRDAAGKQLAPAPFVALRDKTALPAGVTSLRARYEEIFARLGALGMRRDTLNLVWDVVTASDATTTDHLVGMRDEAFARLAAGDLGYRIDSMEELPGDPLRLRVLQLVLQAPWYLGPDSLMRFGAGGKPQVVELHDFPVTALVPRCAATATAPLPIVVFGHGLFGNAKDTVAGLAATAQQFCVIIIASDWIGLSSADLPIIITQVLGDLNKVYVITDRLQQGHVNAQVMTRMFLTKIKDDAALKLDGRPITDGSQIYYFGVSNGGIQGGTFMALSPDVERGVLNVPGGMWSLMIFRSTQFLPLQPFISTQFPDPLDRQVLVTASQSEWDHSDPINFAPHLTANPLPGSRAKRIILQESIGDAQVPNMATRILARTIGLPGVGLVQPVPGVTEVAGPVDSAYTQWDRHRLPLPPATNMPAPSDNGAHDAIQRLPKLLEQVQMFLRPDGRVVNTCGGPCDFP